MIKKFLLLLLILLTSCAPKIEEPDNLIEKDKMVEILTDIFIYKQSNQVVTNRSIDFSQINSAIFSRYSVTEEQFKESYTYYFIKDDEFDNILDEVKISLQAEKPDSLEVVKFKKEEELSSKKSKNSKQKHLNN